MAIDTYSYRKTHGLCTRCGRRLMHEEKPYAQCPICRAAMAERIKNFRIHKEEKQTIKHSSAYASPAYSLNEVITMTKVNNLSYGNMVAVLEGRTALRKTFHYGGITKITPNT